MFRILKSHFKILLIILPSILFSQSIEWIKTNGGSGNDEYGYTKRDKSGNIYICGHFSGTFDFDVSANIDIKISNGGKDIFISKFDSYGNYLWTITYGSTSDDEAREFDFDKNGYLYIVGYVNGDTDFDPTSNTANRFASGGTDFYIASYDFNGRFLWANIYGNSGTDQGTSIKVDNNNDLIVTGFFQYQVDFDPSASSLNLTPINLDDIFLAKYNSKGDIIWALSLGGNSADLGFGVEIDPSNNIYLTGEFYSNTIDLDPSNNSTILTNNGQYDAFLAKYTNTGTFLWAKSFGGSGSEGSFDVAVDKTGNSYISISFTNTISFSGSSFVLNPISTITSCFLSYDSDGTLNWSKLIGGNNPYNKIYVNEDNLYLSGQFSGTSDLNPNAGTDSFTSFSGTPDAFMSKYDLAGNYYWSKVIGGTGDERLLSISSNGNELYGIGWYTTNITIDGFALTDAGLMDNFILKTIDESYISPDQVITITSPIVTITGPVVTVTVYTIITTSPIVTVTVTGPVVTITSPVVTITGPPIVVTITNYITIIIEDTSKITGTANNKIENNSISVYPNPSSGILYINSGDTSIERIEIVNTLGDKILESRKKEIDITGITYGFYYLRVLYTENKLLGEFKVLIE